MADVQVFGGAAGMAAILPGAIQAKVLYREMLPPPFVFGVAFEDPKNPDYTMAAIFSITRVPSTKVLFNGYQGTNGFFRVCRDAVELAELPNITIGPAKPVIKRTLKQAIEFAKKK